MRIRAFEMFLGATAASNLADGVVLGALPILALNTGDSPLEISLVSSVGMLPWLVASIPVGLLLDRYNRAHLTDRANLLRACVSLLLAFFFVGKSHLTYSLILIFAFVYGFAEVVVDTGHRTLVAEIVDAEKRHEANARYMSVEILCNSFVGIPIGSFLASRSVSNVLFAISMLYMLSIALKWAAIPLKSRKPPAQSEQKNEGWKDWWDSARDGYFVVAKNKTLLSMTLMTGLLNVALCATTGLSALLVVKVLKYSEDVFGLLRVSSSVAGLLTGLVAARICKKWGDSKAAVLASLCLIVGTLLATLGTRIEILVASWALGGVAPILWNTVVVTYRQQAVPLEKLGRASAFSHAFTMGMAPIGAALGGLLAESIGVIPTHYVAVCLFGFMAVAVPIFAKFDAAKENPLQKAA